MEISESLRCTCSGTAIGHISTAPFQPPSPIYPPRLGTSEVLLLLLGPVLHLKHCSMLGADAWLRSATVRADPTSEVQL
eukprot:753766-Amorphochlora_amoeboformis.AAC.1